MIASIVFRPPQGIMDHARPGVLISIKPRRRDAPVRAVAAARLIGIKKRLAGRSKVTRLKGLEDRDEQ